MKHTEYIVPIREVAKDFDEIFIGIIRKHKELVRCKDCKYRIVNEHFGEPGYTHEPGYTYLKAMCDLDTGDPFELGRNAYDDNWFCADGERKED